MKRLLIVDGYNLINHEPRYKRLAETDLDKARIRLVEDLAVFSMLTDVDIVVVFDAGATDHRERSKASILGIEVWFTKGGESADAVIERLAYDESAERAVVVATSDYAQQKVVSKPGVTVSSARRLGKEIEESLTEARRSFMDQGRPSRRLRVEDRIDGAVKKALEKLLRDDQHH